MKLIKWFIIFAFTSFLCGCGNSSDGVDLQATIDAQATQLAVDVVEIETLPNPSSQPVITTIPDSDAQESIENEPEPTLVQPIETPNPKIWNMVIRRFEVGLVEDGWRPYSVYIALENVSDKYQLFTRQEEVKVIVQTEEGTSYEGSFEQGGIWDSNYVPPGFRVTGGESIAFSKKDPMVIRFQVPETTTPITIDLGNYGLIDLRDPLELLSYPLIDQVEIDNISEMPLSFEYGSLAITIDFVPYANFGDGTAFKYIYENSDQTGDADLSCAPTVTRVISENGFIYDATGYDREFSGSTGPGGVAELIASSTVPIGNRYVFLLSTPCEDNNLMVAKSWPDIESANNPNSETGQLLGVPIEETSIPRSWNFIIHNINIGEVDNGQQKYVVQLALENLSDQFMEYPRSDIPGIVHTEDGSTFETEIDSAFGGYVIPPGIRALGVSHGGVGTINFKFELPVTLTPATVDFDKYGVLNLQESIEPTTFPLINPDSNNTIATFPFSVEIGSMRVTVDHISYEDSRTGRAYYYIYENTDLIRTIDNKWCTPEPLGYFAEDGFWYEPNMGSRGTFLAEIGPGTTIEKHQPSTVPIGASGVLLFANPCQGSRFMLIHP